TQDVRIAPRIPADRARACGIKIAAGLARADRGRSVAHRPAEGFEQCFAFLQQYERCPPRGARPEARQLRQELHQLFDFRTGRKRSHSAEDHTFSSVGGTSVSRSLTATISAPGKRSSTARTIGACATCSSFFSRAAFFCSASVGSPPSRASV